MSFPDDIRRALEQAGIGASSLDRIRLARGVVGKASYVAGAAILGLTAVALVLREPLFLLLIAIFVVILFAIYFSGVLWFAHRHPGEALLEGAELIRWRQLEMGVKGSPTITAQANTSSLEIGEAGGE